MLNPECFIELIQVLRKKNWKFIQIEFFFENLRQYWFEFWLYLSCSLQISKTVRCSKLKNWLKFVEVTSFLRGQDMY